jgi:hypothetical protein
MKKSRESLLEKLKDKNYIESLSERSRSELIAAISVLEPEELSRISSISVAYRIAREKWIKMNVPRTEWEEYLSGKPLFWKSYVMLNKLHSETIIDKHGARET